MTIGPASHLSAEAQVHLGNPPPPLVGFDATDAAAVAEIRSELHPEWEAANEEISGPWIHRHDAIGGVPVVWFAASDDDLAAEDVLVHLHGGAYFLGSPMTNAVIPVPVAQLTGLPVVSIDYRLAPSHKCPAAVDDVVNVVTELAATRCVRGLFGGRPAADSVAARWRCVMSASHPDRLGLLSPWVDLTCSGDVYRTLRMSTPTSRSGGPRSGRPPTPETTPRTRGAIVRRPDGLPQR